MLACYCYYYYYYITIIKSLGKDHCVYPSTETQCHHQAIKTNCCPLGS